MNSLTLLSHEASNYVRVQNWIESSCWKHRVHDGHDCYRWMSTINWINILNCDWAVAGCCCWCWCWWWWRAVCRTCIRHQQTIERHLPLFTNIFARIHYHRSAHRAFHCAPLWIWRTISYQTDVLLLLAGDWIGNVLGACGMFKAAFVRLRGEDLSSPACSCLSNQSRMHCCDTAKRCGHPHTHTQTQPIQMLNACMEKRWQYLHCCTLAGWFAGVSSSVQCTPTVFVAFTYLSLLNAIRTHTRRQFMLENVW